VAEARRVETIMAARGCRVMVIDPANLPGMGPAAPWAPPCLIIPFQWLAVRLAEARGLKPEAMRHGGLSAALAIKTDARP
jgi:fructoselysine-6-P-deglycase FrlB-like protein